MSVVYVEYWEKSLWISKLHWKCNCKCSLKQSFASKTVMKPTV